MNSAGVRMIKRVYIWTRDDADATERTQRDVMYCVKLERSTDALPARARYVCTSSHRHT